MVVDPSGGPNVVGRPSRRSGSGREALLKVGVWSGGSPGGPGVVRRPLRRFGCGRESLPDVWQWSGGFPVIQK